MCDCESTKYRSKKTQLESLLVVTEICLLIWTYYVYVILVCLQSTGHIMETIILLSVFHPLLLLTLWSYLMTLCVPVMPVPAEFHVDENTWEQIEMDAQLHNMKKSQLDIKTTNAFHGTVYSLSYCRKCKWIKPDRCHHCSRCRTCVLRMDHHCPWLSRCIGFHNHKYFILFIHYLFAFSIFIVITCSGILPRIWRRDLKDKVDNRQADERRMGRLKLQLGTKLLGAFNATDNPRPADVASVSTSLVAGTGLSSAFIQVFCLIILFLVLACMLTPLLRLQEELLAWNITTLEKFRPVGIPGGDFNSDIFNMGSVSVNLNQIMGPNRWLWIFPVFTSVGDGVHYDVNVI